MASKQTLPEGEGNIIIISAPSGSGKSTIVRRLLSSSRGLEFSVSYTTRPRRAREREGKDYFFITVAQFKRMIAAGEFVEWQRSTAIITEPRGVNWPRQGKPAEIFCWISTCKATARCAGNYLKPSAFFCCHLRFRSCGVG